MRAATFLPPLMIATLLVSVMQAQQEVSPSPMELLQTANQALVDQDFPTATKALQEFLKFYPDDYRAQFNLALVYSMTDRKAEAIELYRKVLEKQKTLVPAHVNLGILLLQDGNAAEAAEHLQAAVDQQPDHWEANVQLARALAALQRLPEARAAYERAILLKPEDFQTHLELARILLDSDPELAERHLRSALRISPSLDEAQLMLAHLIEARETPDHPLDAKTQEELAGLYHGYLEKHPERSDLRLRLGELYLALDRAPEAVRQLQAARAESAGFSPEQSNDLDRSLVRSFLKAGDKNKAAALLPKVMTADPHNPEWPLMLGSLQMEKRQYAEAAAAFRRAAEIDPQSAEAWRNMASAVYLLKDYPATLAALAKVAELGKDTAGSYFLRAITLDATGQQRPALENYKRFLDSAEKKNPDQEFQARQRVRILTSELRRKGVRVN